MPKIDFKKELKPLYQPSAKAVSVVEVPPMNYLMVDGTGDPNTSPAYQAAVEVLFGLSYTLKFMVKKGPSAIDYRVMPLEGLWWADDMTHFTTGDKARWQWTMMIAQPPFVTGAMVQAASAELARKKHPESLDQVRFESLAEGTCAQILHVGPFTAEGPTIERLHQFIVAAGLRLAGKHHEIYLSDVRRAAPERWKTILRQPTTRP